MSKTAQQVMQGYADEMGWNDNTQLAIAFEFLTDLFQRDPAEMDRWSQWLVERMTEEVSE